jgi:hypothetical protein
VTQLAAAAVVFVGLSLACAADGGNPARLAGSEPSLAALPPVDAANVTTDGTPPSSDGQSGAPMEPAAARFQSLVVPGFLPAVVYVPEAADPRPLVVANHGAGGIPEAECAYWSWLTRGRAFVLCLRGTPLDSRSANAFYYKDHLALGREFVAARRALSAAFGARLAGADAIYAGFSQGAIMGAPMIVPHARDFTRLALLEGGYEYWSRATARSFARNGGQRVLFVCGTRWCAEHAELPAEWLRNEGVMVRIEYAPGAGHTPGGAVMRKTESALPWLVEGEASWSR